MRVTREIGGLDRYNKQSTMPENVSQNKILLNKQITRSVRNNATYDCCVDSRLRLPPAESHGSGVNPYRKQPKAPTDRRQR
jgi:hypothetical protein